MKLGLFALAAGVCAAQPAEQAFQRMQESRLQVLSYLTKTARSVSDRAVREISSRDSWESLRGRRAEELRDMLGLLPWPERTPLNLRIAGKLDQPGHTIEKIAFESLPKFYVTANLYIPKQAAKPVPVVVYVCAHNGGKGTYQHYAQILARNGYAALIIDPIQQAEAFGMHHGIHYEEMYDWYARGYTPAGVEVWNVIRAMDYLETRAEIDSNRIGMTGFSGGAMMTYFTAAIDPRIKAAAPFMGIGTYAANLAEDAQNRHCDCMFPVNFLRHDLMHLGALIAPRPLQSGQGVDDILFPRAGYLEFAASVGNLYRSYGQEGDFRLLEIEGGHADTDTMRAETVRWFDRRLLRLGDRRPDISFTPLPERDLLAYPQGPPADAQNFRAHELLIPTPVARRFSTRSGWESRRAELIDSIRRKVLVALPDRPRDVGLRKGGEIKAVSNRFDEVVVSSRDTVPVHGLLRRLSSTEPRPGLLYVASDGDETLAFDRLLRGMRVPSNWAAMAVFPRGVGEVPWSRVFHRLTLRNAMPSGETVDSMRLSDVLAALEAFRSIGEVDPGQITILGRNVSGALGLYAALLDPGVRKVMLIDPPATHAEGPIFLNVLRYTDLPEAAALLAPRSLRFYMRMPAPYEYTRHVYELYGAADAFGRVARITER